MNSVDVNKARNSVSIINDPFNTRSMKSLRVFCYKLGGSGWSYNGAVEFQNGDTEGQQNFKGKDLRDVLMKIEAFVKDLE